MRESHRQRPLSINSADPRLLASAHAKGAIARSCRALPRRGLLDTVPCLEPDEVARYRSHFEAFEYGFGGEPLGTYQFKPYLHQRWAYEIATHPTILDAVEDIIGPNIRLLYFTDSTSATGCVEVVPGSHLIDKDRRIGLGISYVPTHVSCSSQTRLRAVLVRGTRAFNHFDDEPVPDAQDPTAGFDAHRDALARWNASRAEQVTLIEAQRIASTGA